VLIAISITEWMNLDVFTAAIDPVDSDFKLRGVIERSFI